MSVLKRWNETTSQWEVAIVGTQGPTGPTGPVGASGPSGSWATNQVVEMQTSSYVLQNSDVGKMLLFNSVSGITCTVNSSLDLQVGQRIDVLQSNTGQLVVAGSGVTINGTPGLKLRSQYSSATILCIAADTYVVIGDLSA